MRKSTIIAFIAGCIILMVVIWSFAISHSSIVENEQEIQKVNEVDKKIMERIEKGEKENAWIDSLHQKYKEESGYGADLHSIDVK